MDRSALICRTVGAAATLAVMIGGCGNDSNLVVGASPTATLTATPTRTPTLTPTPPTSSALEGLVVVSDDVAPRSSDLGVPPSGWGKPADEEAFQHALAHADFLIDGMSAAGITAADGSFAVPDLPPGRYTIELFKTVDGNLLPLSIPVVVGDAGTTRLIVEVGMGTVRTTTSYADGGAEVREIRGPQGNWVILRDGQLVSLSDRTRVLQDADGDGRFDAGTCSVVPTLCGSEERICADGTFCQCVSSCPFCDDCVPPGVCNAGPHSLYLCNPDQTCALPGDRCVDSCPECFNGGLKVCVPNCDAVDLTEISVSGPLQLVVGRRGQLYATAQLSDGSILDLTYLADWQSSDESIATVDSWGRISAVRPGSVTIAARVGDKVSRAFTFEVVERPTLRSITLQNTSCFCRPVFQQSPTGDVWPPCYFGAPDLAILPYPSCSQTIVTGASISFTALGQYADDSYEDVTARVDWNVAPNSVGDMDRGTFTARAPGTALIHASLDGVSSDATEVRVVSEPTVQSLSIYPENYAYDALAGGPIPEAGASLPCFGCTSSLTVLVSDRLRFRATAHLDTGEWRDVSDLVTWRSSNAATVNVDEDGVATALAAGNAGITASLDTTHSNQVDLRVVAEATIDNISIYQEGYERVVAKADQRFFRATAVYDIGIVRDVTSEATWHSGDENIGSFEAGGVFTGRAAGTVDVWASVGEKRSQPISIEVYEATELAYCDPADINRGVWSDDFNRVVLESDCRSYTQPGLVTLRYTVTETRPHGGIFDPCLDLYVYDGEQRIRTIREEGCGEPFLPGTAPGRDEAALKYQLRAFWDLKDDNGHPVPPGSYQIHGRFYLYYDPVVSIQVEVGSDGSSTPRPTRPPASPTPTPFVERIVSLTLGSAVGRPGDTVHFDVAMKSIGIPVAGVQNDLFLAGWSIDAQGEQPHCEVDPAINKPASAFRFLANGGVRALIIALDNTDAIPDGAVVYRCTTTIPATIAAGTYGISCQNASASDPHGGALAVRCTPGSIQVRDPGGSPDAPPPADVQGNCYIGSASCSGSSSYPTAQERCCSLATGSAGALLISWCPTGGTDANGTCVACTSPCGN